MSDLQLDVESLRTYLAVLDAGGMTRAAERLGMSQSAVSWKIKRLEERVGRPLLIRDGHTLRPTRDGRGLLEDARTIVALHDEAVWRLRGSEVRGKVRVGSNEEIDATHIAALLGRFKRSHPNATIELVIDGSTVLTDMVDHGTIDVALIQVTTNDLRPDDVILWSDDLHWVTSWEWTYDEGPVPLITFGSDCFYQTLGAPQLRAAGIESSVAFSAPTHRVVEASVAAGLGVGILTGRQVHDEIIDWPRAAGWPKMPEVHQIARTVPGESPAVAAALVDVFSEQLDDAIWPTPDH